jgi:hypothetical protein
VTRKPLLGGVAAAGICLLSSVAAYEYARPPAGGWQEVAWPFLRDAWPAGRAYHCDAAACGEEMDVYARPKIGFCNCTTGVADDDEVDRVADLDLLSERFVPQEAGKVIHVADMAGRARSYTIDMPDGSKRTAVGIAASRRCDLMVAVAVTRVATPGLEQKALAFLDSHIMTGWINTVLASR